MAITMQMKWDGVTPDQYDKAREIVNMDVEVPEGLISHVAAFHNDAIHVNDIWETEDQLNDYVQNRLMKACTEAGMTGQPQVEVHQAHAIQVPSLQD